MRLSGKEWIAINGPGFQSLTPEDLLEWILPQIPVPAPSPTPTPTPAPAPTPTPAPVIQYPTVLDYGAKGDGVTDDSAAFQAAINAGVVRIPYSACGYMIRSPLNATNRDRLTIEGVGMAGPQWGLAYLIPVSGSTILAGTSGYLLDITGSNNVTLRNFNISSLGISGPSTIGIIGGSGNRGGIGAPGGSGLQFENICVAIANFGVSIPIYLNNVNLSTFKSVATVGKYGLSICANNPLGASPPYDSFGTITKSCGNTVIGGLFLGYGDQPVLFLESANDTTVIQTYTVYAAGAAGKSSYSGCGYAVRIDNCFDCDIKIENDFFPYLFLMNGDNRAIRMSGISCPGGNLQAGAPVIGFFNGTSVADSEFKILPVGYSGSNYLYATTGGAATMGKLRNCEFLFDSGQTPNFAYLNMVPGSTFMDLRFHGDSDTLGIAMLLNGSAAPVSAQRYFVNGRAMGTG
jgi:hypothetical protein